MVVRGRGVVAQPDGEALLERELELGAVDAPDAGDDSANPSVGPS
jgi:hypothetical protein